MKTPCSRLCSQGDGAAESRSRGRRISAILQNGTADAFYRGIQRDTGAAVQVVKDSVNRNVVEVFQLAAHGY